jgi:hypothetical protein
MSRPKQYSSDAERQAAYRERSKEKQAASVLAALPSAPGVANMAAKRRWQSLLESARSSLALLQGEMATYYDDRSEAWQGSERGENHQNDLDTIDQAISLLGELESV